MESVTMIVVETIHYPGNNDSDDQAYYYLIERSYN
jgi:hypothetical protein